MLLVVAVFGCSDGGGGTGGAGGAGAAAGAGGVGGLGGSAGAGGEAGAAGEGCTDNDQCSSSEYCQGDSCRAQGECTERPTGCDEIFNPVCGCDFETYDNACEAALAGVRVSSEGECPCFSNDDCDQDEFCDSAYACSGAGECVPRPESCGLVLDPVCGCDADTYDNACFAAASGVRVSALGSCDCNDNADCDPDAYCNALTCDGPGVCEVKPILEDCPSEADRVLACNGNGFENPCRAAAAGLRIDRSK